MSQILSVGLGEAVVSNDPRAVLVAYGLGSCLGVAIYDSVSRLAGLLHAVLPINGNGHQDNPYKYVDSGIQALIEAMEAAGGQRRYFIVKLVGGANMLLSSTLSHTFEIGTRNVQAAYRVLETLNLKVTGAEVGGNVGRTVKLFVESGKLVVRQIGGIEQTL